MESATSAKRSFVSCTLINACTVISNSVKSTVKLEKQKKKRDTVQTLNVLARIKQLKRVIDVNQFIGF